MPSRAAALASGVLMASGLAGVVIPDRVAPQLGLDILSGRGRAEVRAGLGGTYAALGAYGLLSRDPAAHRAVGLTWLGAAATRVAALALDEPETDASYWAYLALELGLGGLALVSSARD